MINSIFNAEAWKIQLFHWNETETSFQDEMTIVKQCTEHDWLLNILNIPYQHKPASMSVKLTSIRCSIFKILNVLMRPQKLFKDFTAVK